MEVKEVERAVITKPVASRPSCSSFRSFSELLAGAINDSPSPANVCSETSVAAIRPKTIRVKPTVNRAVNTMLSSQGEASGTAPIVSWDKVSKLPEGRSSVVYKPLAKVVSKATVSLLASMGPPSITHQQALAQVEARAQHFNHITPTPTSGQISSQLSSPVPSQAEKSQLAEPSKRASETVEEEPRQFTAAANVDRPSYDGYNWRKYGQKQVKGSEYPRSYYKCTHPNCPVKKKVERSFDGQIAEIVYKGEHSHPKPQPPKKNTPVVQGQVQDQDANNPKWTSINSQINEGSEGRLENHGERSYMNKPVLLAYDPCTTGAYGVGDASLDNLRGRSADCEEGSKGLEVDQEEPRSKRRKSGNQKNGEGTTGERARDPQAPAQNPPETEMLGDGFRWRKYGQKVVKGNPHPRSYYKCTSLKCNVRKYVERASDDPKAFLTTYEGKHNHDMPTKVTKNSTPLPDSQTSSEKKS